MLIWSKTVAKYGFVFGLESDSFLWKCMLCFSVGYLGNPFSISICQCVYYLPKTVAAKDIQTACKKFMI